MQWTSSHMPKGSGKQRQQMSENAERQINCHELKGDLFGLLYTAAVSASQGHKMHMLAYPWTETYDCHARLKP